jgi:glyoxalase-like protein
MDDRMLRCSHVLCTVDDIARAVADYAELGFTVEWGSDPRQAHNALIWFADGPFIELAHIPLSYARRRWDRGMAERIARWTRPDEGWRDVALETDATDLAAAWAALRAAGVDAPAPGRGTRVRPDGQEVRYEYLMPLPAGLPFVVSAYDPPQRPARVAHANGAVGVAAVRMGVAAADRAAYEAIAGADRWLRPEPAAQSGVLKVTLSGLREALDPDRLHGAALSRA